VKIKKMFVIIMIFLITFTTIACSKPKIVAEPVEIQFLLPADAIDDTSYSTSYRELYLNAAENFHKLNPQITIKVVHPTENYSSFQEYLKSNEVTDIVPFPLSSLQALEKEEVLVDLLSLQRSSGSKEIDIYKGILDMGMVNDKLLALPYSIDPYVVIYNKDFFDAAHIPYPEVDWTWEQFRSISKQLKPTGGSMLPYMPQFIDLLMAGYGKGMLSPNGETAVGYLDSPEAVQTVRWLNAYFHDDTEKKDTGVLGTDYGFETFNTGMVLGSFYSYSYYKGKFGDRKDRIGVASLPHFEDGERANQLIYMEGFGITQKSKHPDAAWRFIEYLALSANEDSVKFEEYYLTPSKSMSEAFHQDSDPIKRIFEDEMYHVVKPSPNKYNIDFTSFLTTDDKDIPDKLHDLALKVDEEMIRLKNIKDQQTESQSP
jgi:multiple sugar transport system substrate-binding protein